MPTRQELLTALQNIAAEVMQSLRFLLTLVFSMITAQEPEEAATEAQMEPVRQLIQEVTSQRQKIEELSQIIGSQFAPRPQVNQGSPQRVSPTPMPQQHVQVNPSDVIDMIEVESNLSWNLADLPEGEDLQSLIQNTGTAPTALGPGSSSPNPSRRRSPPMTPPPRASSAAMGSNQGPSRATAAPAVPAEDRLIMHTQADLDWGARNVTWGRKHEGKTYDQVYSIDQTYVKWVLDHIGRLSLEVDFARYVTARKVMEGGLLNVGR